MKTKALNYRRAAISKADRVVIKVGTRLLTDISRVPALIDRIAALREKGRQVILVSSGAVGLGMTCLEIAKRPPLLSKVQALAAVGQCKLMALYEEAARARGFHVGQLLLTATGLRDRERHINALNCVNSLLDMGVLPVINENDSVSVDELKFGDNDRLAALVGAMTRCKLTVILTTIDGLREAKDGKLGDRISVVEKITPTIRAMAGTTDDSHMSVGGMAGKLKAADISIGAGDYLWIADGRDLSVLETIFNGGDVGTLFVPPGDKAMSSRKRWLSFFTKVAGKLIIDDGAVRALVKGGKSLLPAGIVDCEGRFKRGDTVEIEDPSGAVIARGVVNFSIAEVQKIRGLKSDAIQAALGYDCDAEVVHRDNLALA